MKCRRRAEGLLVMFLSVIPGVQQCLGLSLLNEWLRVHQGWALSLVNGQPPRGYNLGGSIVPLWEGTVWLLCFWKTRPLEGTRNQNIFLGYSAVWIDFHVGAAEVPHFFICPLACWRWTSLWHTVISTLYPSSLKITDLVQAFSVGRLPSPFRSGSWLVNPLNLEGEKSGSAGGTEIESRGAVEGLVDTSRSLWPSPGDSVWWGERRVARNQPLLGKLQDLWRR